MGSRSPLEARERTPIHLRGRMPTPPRVKEAAYYGDFGQLPKKAAKPKAAPRNRTPSRQRDSPQTEQRRFISDDHEVVVKNVGLPEDECAKTVRGADADAISNGERRLRALAELRGQPLH